VVFWVVTQYRLVGGFKRFGGNYRFLFQSHLLKFALQRISLKYKNIKLKLFDFYQNVFIITNSYGLGLVACSNSELILKEKSILDIRQDSLDGPECINN
jgi:hypothetical protein